MTVDETDTGGGGGGGIALGCHDREAMIPAPGPDACVEDSMDRSLAPAAARADFGEDLESLATFRARNCIDGTDESSACFVAEFRDATSCQISVGCSGCFIAFGECVVERCRIECSPPECELVPSATDPEILVRDCPDFSEECNECRCQAQDGDPSCFATLDACAGVALSEATCPLGGAG